MKTTCNYPGCNEALPPYRGQGPYPKKCAAHRGMMNPEEKRAKDAKAMRKYRAKLAGKEPVEDDEPAKVIDPVNVELGHKRVELVYDPSGDFRPGARFGVDEIVTSGRNFNGATVWPWVAPGMMFEVYPYGKEPNRYRVNADYRMERVG